MSDNPYFIDYPYPCQCGDTTNLHVSSTNLSKISAKNIAEVTKLILAEVLSTVDNNGNVVIHGKTYHLLSKKIASREDLGVIKVGDGLTVTEDGTLSTTIKINFFEDGETPSPEEGTIYINKSTGELLVSDGDSFIPSFSLEEKIISGGSV